MPDLSNIKKHCHDDSAVQSEKMRKPEWLKIKKGEMRDIREVERMLAANQLHTVCREANCPNRMECYGNKTATFLIMGPNCTRGCRFCNVTKEAPLCLDPEEPAHVAKAVVELGLKHAVVTSVTRDDLEDGGAAHFVAVIRAIREASPGTSVEVLIPDLRGNWAALEVIMNERPDILNHNVETIERLYPEIRPEAEYSRSLELLQRAKAMQPDILTKSGLMLGLGETEEEVLKLLKDLRAHEVDLVTIGQYLPPSAAHYQVKEYVHPEVFEALAEKGMAMGFQDVSSGPLVRSSYNAGKVYDQIQAQGN
ncbi:lipoyl synthase [Acidaminobacter hydrogenoformans]|uniref:Lipoyl synthase n=1 Tax=Acidaminobacter hydrogenoformans DSM 2784 TaxID=1120920 RepID=A0A1G5RYA9_9FIRM|nr:lipoyl synthase [Acidaminobacter hydrogenoformans]SCZ78441.1 lipoic acid synthetase [Acidaminobacter hydrogenoformans DSM 2784]